MRIASVSGLACSALLCIGATDTVAWTPATSPDGSFAVATPCSATEVAALRQASAGIFPGAPIDPGVRILCRKDQLLFLAGVISVPTLPPGAASLYDYVAAHAQADPTAEGTPTTTRLDGHRAYLNRQQAGTRLAQTGFVEVSPMSVVVLVAGTDGGSARTVTDQSAAVDRFYGSLRIVHR